MEKKRWRFRSLSDCFASNAAYSSLASAEPEKDGDTFALHEIADCINAAKDNVPIFSLRKPFVRAIFDRYRACLVAPDHVITAHFDDY